MIIRKRDKNWLFVVRKRDNKKTNELAMITKEGNVATYFKTSINQYERWMRVYGR